jgi:uncharacterized protein DUF6766
MRGWVRDQSLSLFFFGLCLLTIAGQWLSGVRAYNAEQTAHDQATVSTWRYLYSSDFGGNLMENWESEFLQFSTFILAAIWLVQRGSAESKDPDDAGLMDDAAMKVGRHAPGGAPRWARVQGWKRSLYENSLLVVMTTIFLLTWWVQSLTNWNQFNEEQTQHGEATTSWLHYLGNPDFWQRSFQNWQSEFLAVGTMAIFTVYLRQRGSPESKAVGDPHEKTGSDV